MGAVLNKEFSNKLILLVFSALLVLCYISYRVINHAEQPIIYFSRAAGGICFVIASVAYYRYLRPRSDSYSELPPVTMKKRLLGAMCFALLFFISQSFVQLELSSGRAIDDCITPLIGAMFYFIGEYANTKRHSPVLAGALLGLAVGMIKVVLF